MRGSCAGCCRQVGWCSQMRGLVKTSVERLTRTAQCLTGADSPFPSCTSQSARASWRRLPSLPRRTAPAALPLPALPLTL